MTQRRKLKLDEIGYWSEIKLDIIRDYAKAYSTILAAQEKPRFHHVYIDAFAGAGVHHSKTTGAEVEGSPVIAVNTQPPFKKYHFIDLDGLKGDNLRNILGNRPDIHIHQGNCNKSWVTAIRDQCLAAEVPFFFKQWGGVFKSRNGRTLEGRTWDAMPELQEGKPSQRVALAMA
jgi:three-Cys-motif partner protein